MFCCLLLFQVVVGAVSCWVINSVDICGYFMSWYSLVCFVFARFGVVVWVLVSCACWLVIVYLCVTDLLLRISYRDAALCMYMSERFVCWFGCRCLCDSYFLGLYGLRVLVCCLRYVICV